MIAAFQHHIEAFQSLTLRRRALVVAALLAGYLYPLAGFIAGVFFRIRSFESTVTLAPIVGAVVSLALYVIQFVLFRILG